MEEGKEIWKPIPGYEDRYLASSLGRIKSFPSRSRSNPTVLKMNLKPSGYYNVLLCKNGKAKTWRVHRLIAMAFLPNPSKLPQVNHKNGIKTDNRIENLEWSSASANMLHAYRVLGHKSGGGEPRKKIKCAETSKVYESLHDAERRTGISRQALAYCLKHNGVCRGLHWEYVN